MIKCINNKCSLSNECSRFTDDKDEEEVEKYTPDENGECEHFIQIEDKSIDIEQDMLFSTNC